MSEVTVAQFAEVLKVPVEKLLEQLDKAGISVSGATDNISDESKLELLTFLRKSHGQDASGAVAGPRKISLKRKSQSELRLSGAQGRTRTVNVEVRKKRTYMKRDELEKEARAKQEELDERRAAEQAERDREEEEQKLKAESLEEKRRREDQEEKQRLDKEREQREEADRLRREGEAKRLLEAQERERAESERKKREESARADRDRKRGAKTRYGREELHVGALSARRKRKPQRRRPSQINVDQQHAFEKPTEPVVREVKIPETISVGDLGKSMAIKSGELIRALMGMGVMATINQPLDQDTAILLVEELGHTAVPVSDDAREEKLLESVAEISGEMLPRAPVVTVMGHVDHGKTSLLDHIRESRVTAGEAGGITQHIGAYSVETKRGKITFLDTPGHEAFTAMRARGAQSTDIVILVVAADDGVMPQTIEAIQHANAAKVPLIVAVNKIDKPEADVERVRNELSQHEVIAEEWGGEHLFVNVSAQTGEGIDKMLDTILLQAELLELKAPEEGAAFGTVIEASLERGRGPVATILIQRGTLRTGDIVLAGQESGRVRALFDDAGKQISQAGPSQPIVVLGLSGTPSAGDEVMVVDSDRKAREVADLRHGKSRDVNLAQQAASRLDEVFSQMSEGQTDTVQVMVKADVQGSAEALRDSLTKLSTDEVKVKIIGSSVGGITESDVHFAAAGSAIIIGFNVRADGTARGAIKESGVDVRYYSVIYEAIDDVKAALSGLLSPEIREQIVGLAEVREVFKSPKFGQVAGCLVIDGLVRRNNLIRVLRDNVVIYEGELESLRRFKDDVNEVKSGTECGIGVRNYNDVKAGDQIECFERVEVARTLD